MIIGVQRNLNEFSRKLEDVGLNVVELGGTQTKIDAFVYNGSEIKISNIVKYPQNFGFQDDDKGILLVDVFGKTHDEVIQLIKTRVYSPLF